MSDFFSTFKPRDYQVYVHEQLRSRYDAGLFRLLVRMFTGAGKTTGVAAFLPKVFPELMERGPLMFISHRREILFHSYNKFRQIYPEAFIGIEMGEYHATGIEEMLFISVDSLGRLESSRLDKYKGIKPGIIICDEGHHVTEQGGWDRVLTYFGVGSDYDHTYNFDGLPPLVLFLTATPNRGDGKTLGRFVDDYEIDLGIDYGIENGWLVAPDMYDMHMVGRDWGDLSTEEKAEGVVRIKEQYCTGLQTLIFASNVAESKIIEATLNEHGIGAGAGHVDGTTEKEHRDSIVSNFKPGGGVETLTNRLVFTEGFDEPTIQAVIDNGRTQSDALFEQKIGRALRPWPGTVDGLATVEERLAAIANSPKPRALVFVTYDTGHLQLSPQINLAQLDEDGNEMMPNCAPVVDVLLYEDDLGDEVPPRKWEDIENIELFAIRRDIWTGTVFNEKLRAITDQRWIVDQNAQSAALWVPKDPTGETDTPVIFYIKKGDEGWNLVTVHVGGWSEKLGRPRKARFEEFHSTMNFNGTIRHIDKTLKEKAPSQYAATRRNAFEATPATKQEINYLKTNGIPYGEGITSQTAHMLMDDHRIKTSLSKLGLI